MSIHDHIHGHPMPEDGMPEDGLSDRLRWSLRGLRREALPERELWPAISARIATQPRVPAGRHRRGHGAWRRLAPLATAASLILAAGLAWQLRPASAPEPASDPLAGLLGREADAITREYQAALSELDTIADADAPGLRELDRSAAQIRTALARDPDARFLLERLQHTYARRLALTQRLTREPTYPTT